VRGHKKIVAHNTKEGLKMKPQNVDISSQNTISSIPVAVRFSTVILVGLMWFGSSALFSTWANSAFLKVEQLTYVQ
jgi:hypothetical protein